MCKISLLLISGLLAVACSHKTEESVATTEYLTNGGATQARNSDYTIAEVALEDAGFAPIRETSPQTKQIIRKGDISIESKDLTSSKAKLDSLLSKHLGYYEQESTSSDEYYTSYQLHVRIPSPHFDVFLKGLESGGDKITYKSIRAEDVSLQYYDLESRLKSKRAYLERYQNMIPSAKSVQELLEIEEQIRQLQEDIDSQEAVLRSLKDQVSYSSLNINLSHYSAKKTYQNSFLSKISDAFGFGWDLIQWAALGLIGLWPILLAIALLVLFWRRNKNKKHGIN